MRTRTLFVFVDSTHTHKNIYISLLRRALFPTPSLSFDSSNISIADQKSAPMQRLQQLRVRPQLPLTDTQPSNGLGPLLSKLPTELRFMVLGDCIASGHPNFMRASRALHQDGRALIFENGTYRMWFGAGIDDNGALPIPNAYGYIKKFDITLDLRIRNPAFTDALSNLWLVKLSSGRGRKCEVRFVTGCALLVASQPKTRDLLELFRKFEEVVLRVEIDNTVKNGHAISGGSSATACQCEKWEREANVVWIWRFLEPVLGKAEVVIEEGRYSLVYHPGEKVEASKGLFEG